MKKQTKILLGMLIVAVLVIVVLAINFPPVFRGKSSGTIGKADRYQKSQMTEKDVQLRSELTADTARLKGMIQGLMYFAVFTNDLSAQIDSCVYVFQHRGLTNQEAGYKNMLVLNDFSVFIKNNNKTLGNTIGLLSGFYFKDQADQSADVEKNLREFQNYVKTLTEKDSILEQALYSMDEFIVGNKVIRERKTEFNALKSIRDQLLIKTIQFGALIFDRPLTAGLCSYALSSQQQLQRVLSQEKVNFALNQENLQKASQEVLSGITQGSGFGMIPDYLKSMDAQSVLAASNYSIVYDKANLQYVTCRQTDLATLIKGDREKYVGVVLVADDGLKVCAADLDLQQAFRVIDLGTRLTATQLDGAYAVQQNVGAVAASFSNFLKRGL